MSTRDKVLSPRVLIQTLGNIGRPVAYFSKQLEQTVKGCPPCLQAVAATCDILPEAGKFTLGQPTTEYVPHHVLSLLKQTGGYWLTSERMGKYQAIFLDNPNERLQVTSALNKTSHIAPKGCRTVPQQSGPNGPAG